MRSPKTSPALPEGTAQAGTLLFDRHLVRARRERAARGFADFDFLLRHVEEDFHDRLSALNPARFAGRSLRVLTLGRLGDHGTFGLALERLFPDAEIEAFHGDAAAAMLCETGARVVAEEDWLPFADGSFDLVFSPLTLHFANDLPGALIQIRRTLKPGGLFLSALFGEETLKELRTVLSAAEIEAEGGLSPRVIPFTDVKDYGALLQRAGFREPVSDLDRLTVHYSDFNGLVRDLRGMGLTNPMTEQRKGPMSRKTRALAQNLYRDLAEDDGLPASFQILFGTGWAPEDVEI